MNSLPEFNNNNIETSVVGSQIPLQIRLNSRTFVELLEDYYRFLNIEGNPSNVIDRIVDEHDLDKVVDELYLDKIKNEIAKGIPNSPYVQKAFLLQRIVDAYEIRGNTESVLYFFRIFFNEEVSVRTPWDQVLIPSAGKWIRTLKSRILLYVGDETVLNNNKLVQYNRQGAISATIEIESARKIKLKDKFYYDLTLRNDTSVGTFNPRLLVQTADGLARGKLIRSLSKISITDGGKGYSMGDRVFIGGKENISFRGVVQRVDTFGKILQVKLDNYGLSSSVDYITGIKNDPEVLPNLSTVYLNGCIFYTNTNYYFQSDLTATPDPYSGEFDLESDTVFEITGDTPDGLLSEHTNTSVDITATVTSQGLLITNVHDRVDGISIHDFEYYTDADLVNQDYSEDFKTIANITVASNKVDIESNPASFQLSFGVVSLSDGFWGDERHRPSGFSVLQDSFYYQIFSYEINSGIPINNWRSQLGEYLHPAGLKVFGRINSADTVALSTEMTGELSIDDSLFVPTDVTIDDAVCLESSITAINQTYNYDDPDLYSDPYDPYDTYDSTPYFAEIYTSTVELELDLVFDIDDPYLGGDLVFDIDDPYLGGDLVFIGLADTELGRATQCESGDPYTADPYDPYGLNSIYIEFDPTEPKSFAGGYFRSQGSESWEAISDEG